MGQLSEVILKSRHRRRASYRHHFMNEAKKLALQSNDITMRRRCYEA